jgi:hypothetical protein
VRSRRLSFLGVFADGYLTFRFTRRGRPEGVRSVVHSTEK